LFFFIFVKFIIKLSYGLIKINNLGNVINLLIL
jgi:hypothetical protein